jgi:hypothetical protein
VGLGELRGGRGTYLIPAAAIPLSLPHHRWALPFVRLSIQEGVPTLRMVVGISPPHAWAMMGAYMAKMAVVVSPPHCVVSLAFASSEDSGGVHAASLCGFSCIHKLCVSSKDGGGACAASAGLQLLWLGLFEGAQAVTTAVGFLLCHFCLS